MLDVIEAVDSEMLDFKSESEPILISFERRLAFQSRNHSDHRDWNPSPNISYSRFIWSRLDLNPAELW